MNKWIVLVVVFLVIVAGGIVSWLKFKKTEELKGEIIVPSEITFKGPPPGSVPSVEPPTGLPPGSESTANPSPVEVGEVMNKSDGK